MLEHDEDFWIDICLELSEERRVEQEKQNEVIYKICALGDRAFKRRNLPHQIRMEVYLRDEGICVYCDTFLPHDNFTVDHIHPVALGGDDEPENLTVACRSCNSAKGAKFPDEEEAA